jgi:hypothetical protein
VLGYALENFDGQVVQTHPGEVKFVSLSMGTAVYYRHLSAQWGCMLFRRTPATSGRSQVCPPEGATSVSPKIVPSPPQLDLPRGPFSFRFMVETLGEA